MLTLISLFFLSTQVLAKEAVLTLFEQFKYGMSENEVRSLTPLNKCEDEDLIDLNYLCSKNKINYLNIDWETAFKFENNSLKIVCLYLDYKTNQQFLHTLEALKNNGLSIISMEIDNKKIIIPDIMKRQKEKFNQIINNFERDALLSDEELIYTFIPNNILDKILSSKDGYENVIKKNYPELRYIEYFHAPDFISLHFSFPFIHP